MWNRNLRKCCRGFLSSFLSCPISLHYTPPLAGRNCRTLAIACRVIATTQHGIGTSASQLIYKLLQSFQVTFSTHPREETTRWRQTSFLFEESLCVSPGEEIEGIFNLTLVGRKKVDFQIDVSFQGKVNQMDRRLSFNL